MPYDIIENAVLEIINESSSRLTFNDIKKEAINKYGFERLLIKKVVNSLLKKNEIVCTYNLGNTFLEISYNKAVPIGKRFILIPENLKPEKKHDEIYIRLQKGASFGTGSHPTTRMSLKGIEFAFEINGYFKTVLDIGTGSGVLAIAAGYLGAEKIYATDIDELALSEARKNAEFNSMEDRIIISSQEPGEIGDKISLLIANLRYPTLKALYNSFMDITFDKSCFVFSGIRPDEADLLIEHYKGLTLLKRWDERDWAGLVFIREDRS